MSTTVGIVFLLVYVLGAFAYGSALTLSLRQASPVWAAAHRRGPASSRRLDHASLALFAWSAVWFVVLCLDQFSDLVTGTNQRGWLDVIQLVLIFGFPPLIMHTMFLEANVREWPERSRRWASRALVAGYVVAGLASLPTMAIVFGVLRVTSGGAWIGGAIALLFAIAGSYSAVVMNRNPRRRATPDAHRLKRVMNGLFVFLACMNLTMFFSSGVSVWFDVVNRIGGVSPLLFLSATTYYENRFEFYDLLIKRGAMLLATVVTLGAFFAVALPWLDALPGGASRPWLFALAAVPLVLAAPWLSGHLSRRLDRAWFGRHYTPVTAVTTVLASMQAATDEPSLIAAAEVSLKEVLGVTVRLTTTPADAAQDARTVFQVDGSLVEPSLWVVVPNEPGERVLLSEDLTLLRSLGTVVTYLLENVRLQQRRQEQDLLAQELRIQSGQSELKALRAQINPHFLFNALNTVASLVHTDPARADRAVEQLSEVFRHTLRRSESEWAPLDQELAFASAYLDVEEARFGSRLRFTIDADPESARALVPAMLVHTLVENAVKHGIAQVRGHGTLDVTARVAVGRLTVAVIDNGPGPGAPGDSSAFARRSGEQFGLRNVRDRLRGHFGDAASFVLERDAPGARTIARIEMPFVIPDGRPSSTREVTA